MGLAFKYWVRNGQNGRDNIGVEVGIRTENTAEDRHCGHRISTANVISDEGIGRVKVPLGHFVELVVGNHRFIDTWDHTTTFAKIKLMYVK